MNILDGLLGEHAALLTLFEHLEQTAARMDLERLHEAGLLLERVVMAHSIAEDRFLFDAVPDIWRESAQDGDPRLSGARAAESGPASGLRDALLAMRAEHKQLAREFDQLRATGNEAAARGCLRSVVEAIREHLEVEERVLFQVAAKQISPQRLEDLGSAWKGYRMKEALP
ncbi:MAG: hemerythrin domain-containing protein [Bryobacteraceae bacterium]|nr:hemerythrin domain-containing protein [Bryobacteraceae bacterium]